MTQDFSVHHLHSPPEFPRNHEYIFSDEILKDKCNTAAFMLYAYTRIRSIAMTAMVREEQLSKAKMEGLKLEHEKVIILTID